MCFPTLRLTHSSNLPAESLFKFLFTDPTNLRQETLRRRSPAAGFEALASWAANSEGVNTSRPDSELFFLLYAFLLFMVTIQLSMHMSNLKPRSHPRACKVPRMYTIGDLFGSSTICFKQEQVGLQWSTLPKPPPKYAACPRKTHQHQTKNNTKHACFQWPRISGPLVNFSRSIQHKAWPEKEVDPS